MSRLDWHSQLDYRRLCKTPRPPLPPCQDPSHSEFHEPIPLVELVHAGVSIIPCTQMHMTTLIQVHSSVIPEEFS